MVGMVWCMRVSDLKRPGSCFAEWSILGRVEGIDVEGCFVLVIEIVT